MSDSDLPQPSLAPYRLAASFLTADMAALGSALAAIDADIDIIHLDVMDGHFVPQLSFGPATVAALSARTRSLVDVHLMVTNAEGVWSDYARAGAQRICVHYEAVTHLSRILSQIRTAGLAAGVALCPATPVTVLEHVLDLLDVVLVMTVNPGFGGQEFLPEAADKLATVRAYLDARRPERRIPVMADGGINTRTIARARAAGAQEFVLGSAVFSPSRSPMASLTAIKTCLQSSS